MAIYQRLFCQVPVCEVPSLLAGQNPNWQQDWLKTTWTGRDGLKINKNVKKPKGYRAVLHNPRYCGSWLLEVDQGQTYSYLAFDILLCNGSHSCDRTSGKCEVSIKLVYTDEENGVMCSLMVPNRAFSHGPMFKPNIAKLNLSGIVRSQIIEMKKSHFKPHTIAAVISNKAKKDGISVNNAHFVPTINQVREIIKYENSCERNDDLREEMDRFVANHAASVIYPKNQNYFMDSEEKLVVVLRSGPICQSLFLPVITNEASMVGLDAQFRNNDQRFPVFVVTAQNSFFETVPGFVFFCEHADAEHIVKGLEVIKDYLLDLRLEWKATVMIDKDAAERKAILTAGLRFLLCEFHVEKLFRPWLEKSFDANERDTVRLMIKEIARSKDYTELEDNAEVLRKKLIRINKEVFWKKFEKNWLSADWLHGWVDIKRGGRIGLHNTNNASESWFRQLLRTYLHGRKPHIYDTLSIIALDSFGYSETYFEQQLGGRLKPRRNPTLKEMEVTQRQAEIVAETAVVTKSDNGSYTILVGKKSYRCLLESPTCTCSYFIHFGKLCRHILAIKMKEEADSCNVKDKKLSSPKPRNKKKRKSGPLPVEPSQRERKKTKDQVVTKSKRAVKPPKKLDL